MSDIKNQVQGIDPNIRARDVKNLASQGHAETNVYEALTVISKRARQLSSEIKRELHQKLEEFASTTDAIEEISENKEQIEISKFYERLPNPVVISTEEYLNGELYFEYRNNRD